MVNCGNFKRKISDALTGGGSPRKLALSVALGVIVGILPIPCGATFLCLLVASLFRLNQVGIQAANYLAWPLQMALFVPFYHMGATIIPWGPSASAGVIARQLKTDWAGGITVLCIATLKALAVWLLIAGPATVLLYFVFLPIFARMCTTNPKNF